MMRTRPLLVLMMAISLTACFGGAKLPPYLMTLTSEAPAAASAVRRGEAGQTVTIETPLVGRELNGVRIPVQQGPVAIAYVKDAQWVEPPARLFRALLAETLTRTTARVVLDPRQAGFDPGVMIGGTLLQMGYDVERRAVVVRYDALRSVNGGRGVEARRFEASAPADGTAATVVPALQSAANQVARDVATWVG